MKKNCQITLLLLAPIALWAEGPVAEHSDVSHVAAAPLVESKHIDSDLVPLSDVADRDVDLTTLAEDADPAETVSSGPVFGKIAATPADASTSSAGPVTAVVNVPTPEPVETYAPTGPEVVEIPDASIDGVMVDVDAPDIPEVATSVLPSGSDVILQLPGQAVAAGSVTMAQEETISVDFPDEDVRTILRNVADLFDLNLVIPDALQGRTSVKLRNITWRQVYEVVLEPLGFMYVEDRNIIRIKSMEDVAGEPVDTRVFIVNYSNASEIQGSIAPLVDPAAGGRIQVDVRSNALVITERPSRMNKIQEIIDKLDRVTDQVMIESKFIEVRNNNDEDIGIDWAYLNENSGDLLGGSGVGTGEQGFGSSVAGNVTNTGGLVAVFSSSQFAATLTALQSEDRSKLVSNPTVVVMNNQEAIFQVGEDYPVREFSINDQTGQLETGEIEYRFVGVELTVTPTVNAAGMITMDVHPVVSELGDLVTTQVPSGVTTAVLSDRTFLKRDAETQVTIKDGFTIALGGLSRQKTNVIEEKVPFIGDLPYVGRMFSHNTSEIENGNLIIFLTAKTLNPDGSTYADVIDPRQMEAMNMTPDQIPGYQIPQEQLDLMDAVEAQRFKEAEMQYRLKMESSLSGKTSADDQIKTFPKSTWTPAEWERGY